MKTFVRHAVTLLVVTVACQAGLALGEDYYWVSGGDQATAPAGTEKAAAAPAQANGPACPAACCPEQTCDPCCGSLPCAEDPTVGLVGAVGLDAFKGIGDKGYSNFGEVTSLNMGWVIPGAEDFGLGWQTGISYGVYDFDGRITFDDERSAACQSQLFVTTGFYRKAKCGQRVSFGMVYDWMFNDNWGYWGRSPTLGQCRAQVEYAVNESNGIGLWGAQRDLGSVQTDGRYTYYNRAISQVNLFWHHKFACTAADTWVWFGVPDHGRIYQGTSAGSGGSLLDWTVGFAAQVPLSDRVALYANGSYAHPSASAGYYASIDQAYDVGIGIAWYFGGHARSCSLSGKGFIPYMPVANNSNFLVEQHVN
jgi:hypothetical protein